MEQQPQSEDKKTPPENGTQQLHPVVKFEDLEADFRCPITQEIFAIPTTLECGHTVDKPALVEYITKHGGKSACPVCRHVIVNNVNGLSVNIVLFNILDKITGSTRKQKLNMETTILEDDGTIATELKNRQDVVNAQQQQRQPLMPGYVLNPELISRDMAEIRRMASEAKNTFDRNIEQMINAEVNSFIAAHASALMAEGEDDFIFPVEGMMNEVRLGAKKRLESMGYEFLPFRTTTKRWCVKIKRTPEQAAENSRKIKANVHGEFCAIVNKVPEHGTRTFDISSMSEKRRKWLRRCLIEAGYSIGVGSTAAHFSVRRKKE